MRAQMTFIGNATVLLRIGDFTLLTDPAFGAAGSRVSLGHGMWTKRLRDPELSPLDDVDLDGILLSHLHGDHFDRVARRRLDPRLPIITTPQAERRLKRHFTAVRGLPTWESHEWTRGAQRLRASSCRSGCPVPPPIVHCSAKFRIGDGTPSAAATSAAADVRVGPGVSAAGIPRGRSCPFSP
jgi:glyoxylase-like metal-dependent hydrolase (beta-lactamase superfamily II)